MSFCCRQICQQHTRENPLKSAKIRFEQKADREHNKNIRNKLPRYFSKNAKYQGVFLTFYVL